MASHYELIEVKNTRVGFQTGALALLLQKILSDHKKKVRKKSKVELIWVEDREMRKLSKLYKKKDKTTDVLSFSYLEDEGELLGQIFISVDVLKKQAQDQNHPYRQEAEILFVHGLLHLLGYDHEKKSQFKTMKREEEKYLGDKSGLIARSATE